MENLLLEVFGVACPTLLTYAATQHFAFGPVFGKVPKATNDMYMTCIPAVVYLAYRLYFGFIMAGSTKTPVSYRKFHLDDEDDNYCLFILSSYFGLDILLLFADCLLMLFTVFLSYRLVLN